MRRLLVILFVALLMIPLSAQENDDTLVINEPVYSSTAEEDTFFVTFEEGQVVMLVLDNIFDACLEVTGPDGEVLLEDSDVTVYTTATIEPFRAPQTGTYQLRVGDFRCDPFERDRGFTLIVWEVDFPVLGPEPVVQRVGHTERLMLADLEAGTRYRLTVDAGDDLPPFRTLRLIVDETPNAGLDPFTLPLQRARYAEYVFEADHTGQAFVIAHYRQPNPAVTEGIDPIEITVTLEDIE